MDEHCLEKSCVEKVFKKEVEMKEQTTENLRFLETCMPRNSGKWESRIVKGNILINASEAKQSFRLILTSEWNKILRKRRNDLYFYNTIGRTVKVGNAAFHLFNFNGRWVTGRLRILAGKRPTFN